MRPSNSTAPTSTGPGRAADPRVQVRQVPAGAAAPQHHAGARRARPTARRTAATTEGAELLRVPDPQTAQLRRRLPDLPSARRQRRRRSRSPFAAKASRPEAYISRSARCSSWYRSGEDVQAKIPSLSTYLGHREPASTYWYLSAAPELLALAAARQDTAWSTAAVMTLIAPTLQAVLHRPARPAATGQPADHRCLPRRPAAAPGVRAPTDREDARPARLGRPGRQDDLGVPQPSGDADGTTASGPATFASPRSAPCSPTPRCVIPSTRC